MPTQIKKCTCVSVDQDKRYGPDNRVHNQAPKGKNGSWRCTVCNREKD